jgi:hypothetical protein
MSDKLRHFPERDPVPLTIRPEKQQAQAEIDAAIAEYLARGGRIDVVGSEANRNPQFIIGNVMRPQK